MKEGRTIYGGGGGRTGDPVKQAEGYTKIADITADEELKDMALAKAKELVGGPGYKKPTDTKVDSAKLLAGNLKGKPQETERTGERDWWNPTTWFGDDTISSEAASDAVTKTVNELVRKHGYTKEQAMTIVQDEYNAKQSGEGARKYLPEGKMDVRSMFTGGVSPFEDSPAAKTSGDPNAPPADLSEFIQEPTQDVPEGNIPKTFQELGLTDAADQQTFQEMQEAIPDRDLRQEFEDDPEGMQRLMKLWRDKKLNKKNIGKAFSALQTKAKESLGIT